MSGNSECFEEKVEINWGCVWGVGGEGAEKESVEEEAGEGEGPRLHTFLNINCLLKHADRILFDKA